MILLSLYSVLLYLFYGLYFKVCFVWRVLWFPLCHFHLHEMFSHHLSICVSFALNWVSCRQHNVGSHFFTQSATLCILIGTFCPLTFKAIIIWYVFIAILSPAFPLIFKFLPWPPPPAFFVVWIIFVLCSFWFLWICCLFLICGYLVFHVCIYHIIVYLP